MSRRTTRKYMGFLMAPAENADMRERAINNLIMATASLQAVARRAFCFGCVVKPTVEEQQACPGCAAWLDQDKIDNQTTRQINEQAVKQGEQHGVQAEAQARQVGRDHPRAGHKYSD